VQEVGSGSRIDAGRKFTRILVHKPLDETTLEEFDRISAINVRAQIPVGRMGQDSEIASLVAYLAGPEAAYINGAALTIDGGFVA